MIDSDYNIILYKYILNKYFYSLYFKLIASYLYSKLKFSIKVLQSASNVIEKTNEYRNYRKWVLKTDYLQRISLALIKENNFLFLDQDSFGSFMGERDKLRIY